MSIVIVDYGRGNLRSVAKALERYSRDVVVSEDSALIARADKLVLPGVGAFGDCMQALERLGLAAPIRDYILANRPFLGICLGLQVLFEDSEESPGVKGLGIFKGKVKRFIPQAADQKVPHMGWNTLRFTQATQPMWQGISPQAAVYFVHSYYVAPADARLVAASSTYIQPFCAAIARDRLFACQFHPEKSQAVGLKVLENFVNS